MLPWWTDASTNAAELVSLVCANADDVPAQYFREGGITFGLLLGLASIIMGGAITYIMKLPFKTVIDTR